MNLNTQENVVVAALQAFLYALYFVTLVYALRWLLYKEGWKFRNYNQVNWALVTITFVVFLLTTADLTIRIIAWQLAFAGGDLFSQKMVIAGISIEGSTLLLTDATLIIRCWVVFRKSWHAICFPLVLWVANIVCMANWIIHFTMWAFVSDVPYKRRSRIFLQLFYCLNFVTNFYATSAIAYRLWNAARVSRNRQSSILYRICRVVVTTGMLYTCTSLPLVVTAFLLEKYSAAYKPCDALNFSTAGITFNLFLVRIGKLRSELCEVDVEGRMSKGSESVLLTTVQFGVATLASTEIAH